MWSHILILFQCFCAFNFYLLVHVIQCSLNCTTHGLILYEYLPFLCQFSFSAPSLKFGGSNQNVLKLFKCEGQMLTAMNIFWRHRFHQAVSTSHRPCSSTNSIHTFSVSTKLAERAFSIFPVLAQLGTLFLWGIYDNSPRLVFKRQLKSHFLKINFSSLTILFTQSINHYICMHPQESWPT